MFAKNRYQNQADKVNNLLNLYSEEKIESDEVLNKLFELKIPLAEMSYMDRLVKEYRFFDINETPSIKFQQEVEYWRIKYLELMAGGGIPIKEKTFKEVIAYYLFELKHKYMLQDYGKVKDKTKFWEYVDAISNKI